MKKVKPWRPGPPLPRPAKYPVVTYRAFRRRDGKYGYNCDGLFYPTFGALKAAYKDIEGVQFRRAKPNEWATYTPKEGK